MGFILTTRGWTGASIEVVHASGTDTFTIAGAENNAYDVAVDFAAWLDDPARVWSGALTGIAMSIEDNGDGRLCFVFTASGTSFTSFTCDAEAAERIRVSKTSPSSGASGTCRGSCSGIPGTVGWERLDTAPGGRCRNGSWRTGHPSLSPRLPAVELAFNADQLYAFNEAVRLAAQPRTAYLYDELADTWRWVTLGKHELEPLRDDDVTKYVGTLEAFGGV